MQLVIAVVLSGALLGSGCGSSGEAGVMTPISSSEAGSVSNSGGVGGAGGTASTGESDAMSGSTGGRESDEAIPTSGGGRAVAGISDAGQSGTMAPTDADFYFIGYAAGADDGAQHCVYAYHWGQAPTDIFCSPFELEASHPLRSDWLGLAFILSAPTPDIYPQLLLRADLTTGETALIGEYGYSLLSGSWEQVREVWSLGADRTLLSRSSNTADGPYNLVLVGGDGVLTGLREAQPSQHHIIGELWDGTAIVNVPEQGLTLAVLPDGSISPIGSEGDSIVQLSPNARQVLFSGPDDNGDTRLKIVEPGTAEPLFELVASAEAGWADDEHILTATDNGYVLWTPAAEDPVQVLEAPDYESAGGHLAGKGFVAFRAIREDEFGIGWLIDGQFEELCGSSNVVRTLELPAQQDYPSVLFDDAELDKFQTGVGSIYSCEPGGTPVDLLSEFGLQGRLLSIPPRSN